MADEELAHADFVAGSGRASHGMICLDSALAHEDLTDEIPQAQVAVPAALPRTSTCSA